MPAYPFIQKGHPCIEITGKRLRIVMENSCGPIWQLLYKVTFKRRGATVRAKKEVDITGVNALTFFFSQRCQYFIVFAI